MAKISKTDDQVAGNIITTTAPVTKGETVWPPESKRFGGSEEADANPILDCHVAGTKVRDLPQDVQNRILFAQTDEGIALADRDKQEPSGVSVGAGPEDKALQQRRTQIKDEGYEPYYAKDLMKELADKHVAPGMRGKFLSQKKVKENGSTGDYVVVKDERGDPVSYKGMILGEMPEKRAIARNRFFQEKSREMLHQNDRQFKEAAGGGSDAIIEK